MLKFHRYCFGHSFIAFAADTGLLSSKGTISYFLCCDHASACVRSQSGAFTVMVRDFICLCQGPYYYYCIVCCRPDFRSHGNSRNAAAQKQWLHLIKYASLECADTITLLVVLHVFRALSLVGHEPVFGFVFTQKKRVEVAVLLVSRLQSLFVRNDVGSVSSKKWFN